MDYFGTSEIQALQTAGDGWLGVKYKHMGRDQNGVDCTKFVGLLLKEINVLSQIDEGAYYGRDWFVHDSVEIMLNTIEAHEAYLPAHSPAWEITKTAYTPEFSLQAGDLVAFRMMDTWRCNHCAIAYNRSRLLHCIEKRGVIISPWGWHWKSKAAWIYRITETE